GLDVPTILPLAEYRTKWTCRAGCCRFTFFLPPIATRQRTIRPSRGTSPLCCPFGHHPARRICRLTSQDEGIPWPNFACWRRGHSSFPKREMSLFVLQGGPGQPAEFGQIGEEGFQRCAKLVFGFAAGRRV